jgi:hypothetical protein
VRNFLVKIVGFGPRKKKGAKKKATPLGASPPDPQDLSLSCQAGSQKPGGEQKTKPDISFVKKTGHFNLSKTEESYPRVRHIKVGVRGFA